MAAFVQENVKGANAASASQVLTLTNVPSVGDHVIIWCEIGAVSGGASISSVTDNASVANTYQIDVNTASTVSLAGGAFISAKIANNTGMTTITVTLSVGATLAYKVEEFSGLATSAWFDAGGTIAATATTAQTTNSVTPAGAGELAVAGFSTTTTAETSFTVGAIGGTTATQAGTSRNAAPDIAFEYLLNAASGAQTAAGTWATAATASARDGLAFYKVAAAAGAQHLLACTGYGH